MFDILKKKLKKIVSSISEKLEKKPEAKEVRERMEITKKDVEEIESIKAGIAEEVKPEIIEKIPSEEEIERKLAKPKRLVERIVKKIVEKKLSEEDLRPILEELEIDLIAADAAYEVVNKLKNDLKSNLVGKPIKRGKEREYVLKLIKRSLLEILSVPKIDLNEVIRKAREEKRPALLLFLGFNGTGKSLSLAKVGFWLKKNGYKVLIAAGDTFRAAAIQQLEEYASKAGLSVIKQKYGADPCAVIFDGRKAAEARGFDVVLADTAGRSHTDKNLMEELSKIVRVNKPDLKILVLDSLTGSDVINQFKFFDNAVGVDAVIFSKVDVNEKGGNILSVCYSFKKPVLFLGNGQGIEDLIEYDPEKFVENLFS